jgi:N-acetylneuraminate synthase
MDKVFIIAEAGVNHNGDINLAYKLIDAALNAGADAVKFQTFKAEKLISKNAERAKYQAENMPKVQETQLDMIKKLELNFDAFIKLKDYCDKVDIQFLTTPFDFESADFIDDLVEIYKIGSGEITNLPFLEHIAKKNKPIILSTGMSDLGEVEKAVDTILANQAEFNTNFPVLSLLHCTTNYPCPYEEVNLNAMLTIKEAFKLPVGYSDHTLGIEVPIAATSLGATIIEKHFTLDRNMEGPDHKASLEPAELKKMVNSIRNIQKALGDGIKKPNKSEIEIMKVARKSIVASRNIQKGEILTKDNIAIKRPGNGISPARWQEVLGMKAIKNFHEDQLIEI